MPAVNLGIIPLIKNVFPINAFGLKSIQQCSIYIKSTYDYSGSLLIYAYI